jgi:hypothetical protein
MISNFEKLNSVGLHKFTISDQASVCQPNPMLRDIPGLKFS